MDDRRRDYFASVVFQSKRLSECEQPKAALIVRGKSILGVGSNRTITTERTGKAGQTRRPIESSPVFDALQQFFSGPGYKGIGGRNENTQDPEEGGVAFLTYFPHVDELKLLYQSEIKKIYFFGDIDDEDSTNFINDLNYFEIINIEI